MIKNNEEIRFFTTGGTTHFQTFDSMLAGDYNLFITCKDASGEIARTQSSLEIFIDNDAPIVVRTYKQDNNLIVLTDEEAECYYDLNRCNFDLTNGTSMTTGFSTKHDAEYIAGRIYHIKCADMFENSNPSCAIIVKAE